MAVEPLSQDLLVAELHESIAQAADLSEVCSIVLDAVARAYDLDRAVLLARSDAGIRSAVWGLPAHPVVNALTDAEDAEVLRLLQRSGAPALYNAHRFAPLPFETAVAFSFDGLPGNPPLGVLIAEAAALEDRFTAIAALLSRTGPPMARAAQIDALTARGDEFARQRDLLNTVLNTLPDPVMLTDPDNNMILSNARAEQLFHARADDSEGRRRAVQINNLLFSSFLTQALIGSENEGARELNLVDTQEGSDLLFEVLTVPFQQTAGESRAISVLRDITDLRHAVSELEIQFNRSRVAEHHAREERDRLNVILENVSDPILVTDARTNIVLLNPEADRLFVVDDRSGGRATRRQIQANDTRFTTLISNFLLKSDLRQMERITIVDPATSREFPVEVISSKILNARGEPTAIVSVVHDLTQTEENERLARELQQLNEQLEDRIRRATVELEERNRRLEWQSFELQKASRLKSEFLANMSHELRTPINVILGYTSLMRERIYGALTDQQDEALSKTYLTSQHLLELINDILDLSKIEAGKMPLHVERVHVGEVIGQLSESLQPMLRNRPLDYRERIDDALRPVRTDPTKLKQVLLNLLSNAIKFTQQGSVSIEARPLQRGEGVYIEVTDTGIGIRPEHIGAIFEDFTQLDQSHTREYGGTGLGLSITKKLLAMLGGTIAVESTYGSGTRFMIELPSLEDVGDAPRAADPAGSQP